MNEVIITKEYKKFLEEIKQNFKNSQIKASIKVNSTLLEFYWYLGEKIVLEQKIHQWGSDFLSKLSKDLSKDFSSIKGFSKSNLQYIKRWYLFYKDAKVEQVVPLLVKIPWGHKLKENIVVEYTLKDINKPLGVSEYRLTSSLPKDFKSSLPSIEEIKEEIKRLEYE